MQASKAQWVFEDRAQSPIAAGAVPSFRKWHSKPEVLLGAFEGAARRSRHSKQPTASSPADVMAKRSQGLLDVGALSHGLLAVSEVICGSSAGGGRFPPPLPPGGQFGRPRGLAPGLFGCN